MAKKPQHKRSAAQGENAKRKRPKIISAVGSTSGTGHAVARGSAIATAVGKAKPKRPTGRLPDLDEDQKANGIAFLRPILARTKLTNKQAAKRLRDKFNILEGEASDRRLIEDIVRPARPKKNVQK